jgi:predicted alpha/beta superfamily hydrolase
LEPSNYPVWEATVSLPADTDFEYQFALREDGATRFADINNITLIGDKLTSRTTAGPFAPTRMISVEQPTNFDQVAVFDSLGAEQTRVDLQTAANRSVATALPLLSGGFLQLDSMQPGITPVSILQPAPHLYLNGSATVGYQTLPPSRSLSASRIVVHNNFSSSFLNNSRSLRVYLPRGYDESPNRFYPVLYMHDGQNIFAPGGAFGSWDVDLTLNNLIARGALPEMVVVGIDNTSDRLTEYTPPFSTIFNQSGRGDLYARFVIEEVAPFIEGTDTTPGEYRVIRDRQARIVAGSSLGGIISAYMAWDFTDFAHRYLCFSSSFAILPEIIERFRTQPARDVILYLDSGDSGNSNDGLWGTLNARDALLEQGGYQLNGNLYHAIGFGDQHNEAAWARRFPSAIQTIWYADQPVYRRGDVNGDDALSSPDVVLLTNLLNDDTSGLTELRWPAADLDASGSIQSDDRPILTNILNDE